MILVSVGPGPGALDAPRVARILADAGHRTEVVLGPGARSFVGPAAFAGAGSVVEEPSEPPGAVLFAPADAGTLSRLAHGLDAGPAGASAQGDLPVFLAPDLDAATAAHPAVRENLVGLADRGWRVVGGREGGEGGMAAAEEVAAAVLGGLGGPMGGLRVLVTAGGTREPMDSVRFIGNRSSGKMGLAVAGEALRRGAGVTVVAANVGAAEPGVQWRAVETVGELREEVSALAGEADVLVMAAAVSDFTPASPAREKIRRGEGSMVLELEPTADILGEVRARYPDLFVVGFAATHGDPVPDAREKLTKKGADLVVGNDISRQGLGFGAEENEVFIVGGAAGGRFVPRATKREVAREILDTVTAEMERRRRG